MSDHAMLTLDALCFRYPGGERDAVHNVSLKIPAATVTSILGPNGSGKTTLLNLLLGLETPTSGTVSLNGVSHQQGRRRLGLVPQDEMYQYSTALRAMSQGTGEFAMEFSHYAEVPGDVAKQLIEAYEKSRTGDDD